MAARKRRINHDPKTIEKIRATQLIKRLEEHVLGEVEMGSTQVTAALGLIKKVVPDQAATQHEISGPDGGPIETKWQVNVVETNAKSSDT